MSVNEDTTGAAPTRSAAYAFKKDDTGTYTYIGEAAPGSATSAAVWRIQRITNADSTIEWADGDGDFNNVWDNRASLSYS